MKRISLSDWQIKCSKASQEGTLRDLVKSLSRGEYEIADDTGRVLDFSPGPTHAQIAPLVEMTRGEFGRPKFKHVEPVKVDAPSSNGAPRLSPEDLASFQMFQKSFEKLPREERMASMDKLLEVFIPRLIHD